MWFKCEDGNWVNLAQAENLSAFHGSEVTWLNTAIGSSGFVLGTIHGALGDRKKAAQYALDYITEVLTNKNFDRMGWSMVVAVAASDLAGEKAAREEILHEPKSSTSVG